METDDEASEIQYRFERINVTPLTYAARFGFLKSAETLLSLGASLSLCDPDGFTALERMPGQNEKMATLLQKK